MLRLQDINERSFVPDHVTGRREGTALLWREFLVDVGCNRQVFADSSVDNWALYETDSYRFAVALVALLAEGKAVYLPGESNRGMVASLQRHETEFVGEFPVASTRSVITGEAPNQVGPLCLRGSVVVFTSGSTGDAKPIPKTLAQLDAELAALESCWGEALKDAVIAGTVSHQHVYGLLFSVLWPLAAGRCFWHKPFVDPAIMARTLADFPRSAWVMSPAHLHRLGENIPWSELRDRTAAVFSSGGPLEQRAAQAVYNSLGQFPYEVLGSSETGGIAWRQQASIATPWNSLPGVDIKIGEEGALTVRSPWLHDDNWYVTADLASEDEAGGFSLGARLDRIVKVEGKRVSLPEVETALGGHPWIEQCALTPVQRRRQVVGAAIVLSTEGAQRYADLGHHQFTRGLRHYLGDYLATAAIPRIWRVASALPRNSQGKILQKSVLALFDSVTLPRLLNRQDIDKGCKLLLQIQEDSPYFDGHFTDNPVLPGVVQVIWAQQFASNLLGLQKDFLGMRKIKFKALVFPLQELTLTLVYTPGEGRLEFQYESTLGRHSQGILLYEVDS